MRINFKVQCYPLNDELALWLSDRAFEDKAVSRKIVSQTLLLLRLTRWLTLCETVRNERGQILGNVYVMNDEPLSVVDCLQLNDDYLRLLEKSVKHQDPLIKDVALQMIEELLHQDEQLLFLVSHIPAIQARYQAHQHNLSVSTTTAPLSERLAEAIEETQQHILSSNREQRAFPQHLPSSNRELSQKIRELSKKSIHSPSSNTELSQQNEAKSLILGLVPNGNSVSTSTVHNHINTSTVR